MTTTFSDAHLNTLMKLKEIAENHNCKIRFGTRVSNSIDSDTYLLCELSEIEHMRDFLEYHGDDIIDGDIQSETQSLWFELYERVGGEFKHHTLSYQNNSVFFTLQEDWLSNLEDRIEAFKFGDESEEKDSYEIAEELNSIKDYFEEHDCECSGCVVINNAPTIIRGFGNKGTIKDYCVYRDGMALKFFSDLVCDYLKEPRIVETY